MFQMGKMYLLRSPAKKGQLKRSFQVAGEIRGLANEVCTWHLRPDPKSDSSLVLELRK